MLFFDVKRLGQQRGFVADLEPEEDQRHHGRDGREHDGHRAMRFAVDRGELVLQMAHRLRVAFAGRRCGGVLGLPRIAGFPEAAWFGGVLAFLGVPAEPAGLAEDVIVAVEIMF